MKNKECINLDYSPITTITKRLENRVFIIQKEMQLTL